MTFDAIDSLLSQEDPLLAAFDPTLSFLALAFEDNVFEHIDSPAALETISVESIKRLGGTLSLDYHEDKKKLLILREVSWSEGTWAISPDTAFQYHSAKAILERMFTLLDYQGASYISFRAMLTVR
jgi:hypothetical protein